MQNFHRKSHSVWVNLQNRWVNFRNTTEKMQERRLFSAEKIYTAGKNLTWPPAEVALMWLIWNQIMKFCFWKKNQYLIFHLTTIWLAQDSRFKPWIASNAHCTKRRKSKRPLQIMWWSFSKFWIELLIESEVKLRIKVVLDFDLKSNFKSGWMHPSERPSSEFDLNFWWEYLNCNPTSDDDIWY